MLNRKESFAEIPQGFMIVCILKVLPELLGGVGAEGCQEGTD